MLDGGSPSAERERRNEGAGDAERELVVAWRTSRGTRLVLAFPGPSRFALGPGSGLDALDAAELKAHLEVATGLTDTEATFRAPDGRRWLAQATGPVWAASEGAEGLLTTRFTSLDGAYESLQSPGSPLRPDRPDGVSLDDALTELWLVAREERGESEP